MATKNTLWELFVLVTSYSHASFVKLSLCHPKMMPKQRNSIVNNIITYSLEQVIIFW